MIQRHYRWQIPSLFLLLCFTALSEGKISAQTKIQVVTKTISKNVSYNAEKTLKIVGEKASINIQSWDKNYISASISLTAKHPNKKTAEQDLKFIDYRVVESPDFTELSNFFTQEEGYKEIKSNLTAKFEIKVPSSCALCIVNIYGSISVENIKSSVNIDLKFAQLNMANTAGNIIVNSYYGDIEAENVNSVLKIQSEMADISLLNLAGACTIASTYGNINITPNERLSSLNIDANRTSIQFLIEKFDAYSFKIETQYADINVPKPFSKQVVKNLHLLQFQQINNKALIQVNGKYSSVTLKSN